jgi:hypothetical protein
MKKVLFPLLILVSSCGSSPMQSGVTDSLVLREQQMNSDSARIPTDPVKRIDYFVTEINNRFLNGELKRKDWEGEHPQLGTLYAYYQNDSTPAYIYTEQTGELSSEQILFYLKDGKLIYVVLKDNRFGKDASGQPSWQIREPYNERHVYFDGDAILKDTTLLSREKWWKKDYDFIGTLMTAQKGLKKAVNIGPR